MKKIVMSLVLATGISILSAVAVYTARGQAVGTAQMENGRVTQGDNMSVDVVLDKGSSIAGGIAVTAIPEGFPNERISLSCGLEPTQTECKATGRMPLDAKVGKWTISEIAFSPTAGGAPKRLSKHGDSSFEVVAHGRIVLPDSATVSDVK
jgi:hypothetical protein